MSLIDWSLLAAILIAAGWWMFAPRRGRRQLRLAPIVLVALAGVQIAIEGLYWQFLPGYLLLTVLAGLAVVRRDVPPGGAWRWLGWAGLTALMLAAIAPFALFLPVPELTRPQGPYAVGTEIFRLVDESREEEATDDPTDRRNVVVQAWYPATAASAGPRLVYIDGLDQLPARVTLIPGFVMRSYGRIDTHAVAGAEVSNAQDAWPVVVFSPGYGAPRAFYTGLVADLASRGYVVLAIDHPYEAAVTELADGRVVTTIDNFPASDAEGDAYMSGLLDVRAGDVRFVLDRMGGLGKLAGHLDFSRIAAIGHSFGGATAAVAMDRDSRIGAAANIDGTLYGSIAGKSLQHPFLLLESDHKESGHGERYLTRNRQLLDNLAEGGWRYEIKRANHFSFTDAPLFLAPPGRFVLSLLIGGGRGPEETQRASVDMVDAFLKGQRVEAVASRYPAIMGGPVR